MRPLSLLGDLNDVTGFPTVSGREFKFVQDILFESKFRGRFRQRVEELVNESAPALFALRRIFAGELAVERLSVGSDLDMLEQIAAMLFRRFGR